MPFSAVAFGLWGFIKKNVLGRPGLISTVFPDRLAIGFQGRNVDFPFEELTEVSIGKVKFITPAASAKLGSSLSGRTVYVRRAPRDRRGFWNHWESFALVGGLILAALGLQFFSLVIKPLITPILVGFHMHTVVRVIVLFMLVPSLILGSILLPLALAWYAGIRPRLPILLERKLRSSPLLEIRLVDSDGFFAALTIVPGHYRRRPAPSTTESGY